MLRGRDPWDFRYGLSITGTGAGPTPRTEPGDRVPENACVYAVP